MKPDCGLEARAAKVEALLRGAYDEHDIEASVTDALTDVMHLCDEVALDFDKLVEAARRHHEEELKEYLECIDKGGDPNNED